MTGAPPLALYIHLPWCVKKCPYCDFNSHTAGATIPSGRYVEAVLEDLALEAAAIAGDRPLVSIYIGGGTPSLFSPPEIGRILETAGRRFELVPGIEITMEANPGAIEHGRLAGYRQAGVNRISLGAQSMDVRMLARLGRVHGPEEVRTAFGAARAAGFDSINLDLMFALPGQELGDAIEDMNRIVELSPDHISCYQLTLEPNTVFHRRPPPDLPDEDLAFEMQEALYRLLAEAGYRRYEISAFARSGHECRHNLNYWTFGDYLGVGAGAHGKYTDGHGRVWRTARPQHPLSYMERAGRAGIRRKRVDGEELAFEFMLNALRLTSGFTAGSFSARTGLPFATVGSRMHDARESGLVEERDGGWRPSARGLRFLDDLQASFLPDRTASDESGTGSSAD